MFKHRYYLVAWIFMLLICSCTSPVAPEETPTNVPLTEPSSTQIIATATQECQGDCLIKDNDGDGIKDDIDRCDNTPPECPFHDEEANPGLRGCSISNCVDTCHIVPQSNADTANLKLHIIFTPCNFRDNRNEFEMKVMSAAETLLLTEPFKSNKDKIRVSFIWSTDKYSGEGNENDGNSYDTCFSADGGVKELDLVTSNIAAGCADFGVNSINVILVDGKLDESIDAIELNNEPRDFIYLLTQPSFEDSQPGSFEDNFLHEIGHAFKFANNQNYAEIKGPSVDFPMYYTPNVGKWNDVYLPDLPGHYYIDSAVCPIWTDKHYLGDICGGTRGILIGCWKMYDAYDEQHSLCDGDIMSIQGNREAFYNPVQIDMINNIFEIGYDSYLNVPYPRRCNEISDLSFKDYCFFKECNFITPSETKNAGYIERMQSRLTDESLKYHAGVSDIFACCSQIIDAGLRKQCMCHDSYNQMYLNSVGITC